MSTPLLALLALAAAANPESLERFALIAGADDGGPGRVQLQYAGSDAMSVHRVFRELGGFDDDNLVLLSEPDTEGFLGGIDDLSARIAASEARTEVFVYYSGHSDERGLLLGRDHLPYAQLKSAIESLPADVKIGILDSCASGSLVRGKGGVHRAPFLVDESSGVSGHAFITSSSADEVSQESDAIGGSFFTHYLVSGLRGAADVDEDGRVTLNEAYRYAFDETLRRTEGTLGGAQHANYDIQLVGTGDLVLTDLRETSAGLVLPADLDGRFFVRDGDNRLQAELRKPPGIARLLGLSPGRYQISLEEELSYATAVVDLPAGEPVVLSSLDFLSMAPEGTVLRGHKLPRERFRGNPTIATSFAATSAVSILTSAAMMAYAARVNQLFDQCQTPDCLDERYKLNRQLNMGAGIFAGVGTVAGVGAAVTWPVKDRSVPPADWQPPSAIQGSSEAETPNE